VDSLGRGRKNKSPLSAEFHIWGFRAETGPAGRGNPNPSGSGEGSRPFQMKAFEEGAWIESEIFSFPRLIRSRLSVQRKTMEVLSVFLWTEKIPEIILDFAVKPSVASPWRKRRPEAKK
jgi:hypothetical protein